MKKRIFLCILSSFIFVGSYAQVINTTSEKKTIFNDNKKIEGKLDDAIIFYQGAQLNYLAMTKLEKGENEISIYGLSASAQENSLNIELPDFAIVSSYKFTLKPINLSEKDSRLQILQDSLSMCKNKISELEDNIINNNNVLTLLKVNTGGNNDGSINLLDLMKYADFYKTKSGDLMSEIREYKQNMRKWQTEVQRLQELLATKDYSYIKHQGVLTIKVIASTAGETPLKISLFTQNAGWTPYYDFNIKSTTQPVDIKFKAAIYQNTDLNWENIRIKLVASQLNNGTTAPTINPHFIDFIQPRMTAKSTIPSIMPQDILNLTPIVATNFMAENNKQVNEEAGKEIVNDSNDKNMLPENYVSHSSNDMGQTFDIDLPYTLQGNGKNQFVDLISKETTANFSYFTIPSIQQRAYLIAEIPDWDKIGLSSGIVNITYNGTYMGETYINTQTTENNLSLTLGVDNRITVQREKLKDFSSKKFLGNDIKQTIIYRTTIKNNQANNITITMKGQYPISNQKSIEVELIDKTTPPFSNDKSTGILTWKFTLKPGETKIIDNAYNIKYPKDSQINI